MTRRTRRRFLGDAGKLAAVAGFPAIVPSSVLGAFSPGNRINVGAIGTGRISRDHDLPGIWQYDTARIMAVCDLDSSRAKDAVTLVNGYYSKQTGKPYSGVTAYTNYRELLANKDVDAVVISTPDHWHALIAKDAVAAGKDVYLQSPRRSRSAKDVRSATRCIARDGSFRSAASSGLLFNFASRRNSCATDGSANSRRSRSGCRAIRPARPSPICPCPRI